MKSAAQIKEIYNLKCQPIIEQIEEQINKALENSLHFNGNMWNLLASTKMSSFDKNTFINKYGQMISNKYKSRGFKVVYDENGNPTKKTITIDV